MSDDLINKHIFIYENINDIDIEVKKELLQIIYNSDTKNKIIEKGNGVQIKFDDIDVSVIITLYDILKKKIKENKLEIDF
jgi:hypothetical protein